MATSLWDRPMLGGWHSQPPPDADASGAEPTRPERSPLLASAEAQALTVGEVFAWVGLAIWGGALVAFVVCDIARTYQHHRPVPHKPAHRQPRRRQDVS